jgi:LPXTG-motif cell wall-anchored protein
VQILRRAAVLLAAIALCSPAVAQAQTTTVPPASAGVSTTPPVKLDGGETPASSTGSAPEAGLPNTGSDPRLLFLVGLALTLLGVGLRLRTADAELY